MKFEKWHKLSEVEAFIENLNDKNPIMILLELQKFCYEEGQKRPKNNKEILKTPAAKKRDRMKESLRKTIEKKADSIGSIGNYHGGLLIAEHEGLFYWAIGDYSHTEFKEIPEFLYDVLIDYQVEQEGA